MLDISQTELEAAASPSRSVIVAFEKGEPVGLAQIEALEKYFRANGIEFIENGVKLAPKNIEIIEGKDCYIRTLDKVMMILPGLENKELLIMFASDAISPPAVNDRYRLMRQQGVKMRQLIKEGDTYIMGELEEYRTIPEGQFVNIVSLVYGDYMAQVNGDETAVTIYRDPKLAAQKRADFEERWNKGSIPSISTAEEKF